MSLTLAADMNNFPNRHRWATGAAVLASTLLPGYLQAAAQQVEPGPPAIATPVVPPDPFVALFSTTCMKFYSFPDQLRAAMKASGTAELSGDAAAFFLNGKAGTAWRVPIEEQPYIVTLRQGGICTVFAQKADIERVRKDFTRLVSKPSPPLEAHTLPGGPGGTTVQTITYAWARPADEEQLVFTLTTSTNPTAPAQAMATVALTAK